MSALEELLGAEKAVLETARAGRGLPDEVRSLPAQSAARVTALREEVVRTGGNPAGDIVVALGTSPQVLVTALEAAVGAAYAAVQKIDDEKTLRVVAQVMAGDGQSLALLREAVNRPGVPSAFETGKA